MIAFKLGTTKFFELQRFSAETPRCVLWKREWYVAHDEFEKNLAGVPDDDLVTVPIYIPSWRADEDGDGHGESLLLMMAGGLGDIISLHPLLHYIRRNYQFHTVALAAPQIGARWFVGGVDFTLSYPTLLVKVEGFDRVVMFEHLFQRTLKQELVDIFADILGLGHVPRELRKPVLYPLPAMVAYWNRLLPKAKSAYKRVVIHTKASTAERSLPIEKTLAIAFRIADEGHTVVLTGGWETFAPYQEHPAGGEEAVREVREGVYNFCGMLGNEEELVGFVRNFDYYIGPDSGLLHVAGALDIPGTCIFTTQKPEVRTGYYPRIEGVGPSQEYVDQDREHIFPDDVTNYEAAIDSIPWDDVVDRILGRLAQ